MLKHAPRDNTPLQMYQIVEDVRIDAKARHVPVSQDQAVAHVSEKWLHANSISTEERIEKHVRAATEGVLPRAVQFSIAEGAAMKACVAPASCMQDPSPSQHLISTCAYQTLMHHIQTINKHVRLPRHVSGRRLDMPMCAH